MAIREKVVLVDDYSAKAKKIESSTSAMGQAMNKIKGTASTMSSALKSAFGRTYKVDIKDVGSKYLEGRVNSIQKSLDSISKGSYKVGITAKMSALDKAKSNLNEVKSKIDSLKSRAINFRTDISNLRNARKEANSLAKQLKAFTGKKHTVKVDMEKTSGLTRFLGGGLGDKLSAMGGGLKSGFSKIGGFFSKLNPFKAFGGGGGGDSEGGGSGGMSMLKSIVGGNLITGAISKGISALSNVASTTLGAGFERLQNIESAKARLKGFGYDNKQIGQITKSATNAVTGTQYSMGDAMTASAGAIAAGIKPGELEGYLKEVGNAAAATGSDFNDVASIMNKVKTTGHLQADEMRQLSDRGLPVLAKLAEQAGVSADEMQERISKGLVSFDEFRSAVKSASGTAAEEVAKTFGGAKDNFKSALSKLGAGLLGGKEGKDGEQGGLFGLMTPALLKVNDVLNGLVPTFQNAGEAIKDFAVSGFEKLKAGFSKISEFLAPIWEQLKTSFGQVVGKLAEVWGPLKEKFSTVFEKLSEAFAPLKNALSSLFGTMIEGQGNKLTAFIDMVATGLEYLADALVAASPYIQSMVEWISANVIPVIEEIVSWVNGTLIPTMYSIAETIMGALMPVIKAIIDFIGGVVMPILQALGDLIMGAVTTAFNVVKDAVQWATDKFNALVGAIGSAIDAFFSIPGKIANALSGIGGSIMGAISGIFGGKKGHATGTSYFSGGLTRINERGEEMIQLARGDKIYPAGKTNRIIKNEVENTRTIDRSADNRSIVINVNGANMTNKDVGRAISEELKRLGVVV